MKFNIKIYDIGKSLEDLQSKQVLGGPGGEASRTLQNFYFWKNEKIDSCGENLNIFIKN